MERPLIIAPNCCLSSLSLTNSRIQPPTIDSNTFDSFEVEDIGRRSDSNFLGGLVLGIGTTFGLFQYDRNDSVTHRCNKYGTHMFSQPD